MHADPLPMGELSLCRAAGFASGCVGRHVHSQSDPVWKLGVVLWGIVPILGHSDSGREARL